MLIDVVQQVASLLSPNGATPNIPRPKYCQPVQAQPQRNKKLQETALGRKGLESAH